MVNIMSKDNLNDKEKKEFLEQMLEKLQNLDPTASTGAEKKESESTFDKLTALGKAGRIIEATQDDAYFVAYGKDGKAYPILDFVKSNIDNARFKAGLMPFFEDEYLWDKNNFKGYKKPFPDGVGHKEMFQSIAETEKLEDFFDFEGFDPKKLEDYRKLEANNFKQKELF